MFYVTKTLLFYLICSVWITAYIDDAYPYFPIELSRTATGEMGKIIFPAGACAVALMMWLESAELCMEYRLIVCSGMVGFLLLAFVHDELHWKIHLLGCFLMAAGISAHVALTVYLEEATAVHNTVCLTLSWWILTASVCTKVYVVLDDQKSLRDLYNTRKQLFDKCMHINYHGECTDYQKNAYRITGVFQWIVFGLMISTYD